MSVTLLEQYRAMARYNRWINGRIFDAAGELSDDERKRDLGAFFGSLHRTLNHILLADRIWLSRLGFGELPAMTSLADELFAEFADLRRERDTTDAAIDAMVAALDDAALGSELRYRNTRGDEMAPHPRWFAISQIFNHETHHRGQATTLLMQLGKDPGVTDLIAFLRNG